MRDSGRKPGRSKRTLYRWATCVIVLILGGISAVLQKGMAENSPSSPATETMRPQIHRFKVEYPPVSTGDDTQALPQPGSKDSVSTADSQKAPVPPPEGEPFGIHVQMTHPAPLEREIPGEKKNRDQAVSSAKKIADQKMEKSKIKAIQMKGEDDSEEIVEIFLTGYHPPEISVPDGDPPRVVCDFHDVRIDPGFPRLIEAHGNLVQRIRLGIHLEPERKTRVVLDLSPSLDYEVEQYFFEAEYLYTLKVRKKP